MKRRRLTKLERVLLFRRTDGLCPICGAEMVIRRFHADHVIPFRDTGRTVLSEMQATCPRCNLRKGTKHGKRVQNLHTD